MTILEAASRLSVSPAYVRLLLWRGTLRGTRTASRWDVDEESVETYSATRRPRGGQVKHGRYVGWHGKVRKPNRRTLQREKGEEVKT